MRNGFGWFTVGSSLTSRFRERGVRRGIRTPKRYETFRPFTAQEQLVIEQLRAERLGKEQRT